MTSPAASPQKPAITNSTASPARLPSIQPTPTHNSLPAVAAAAAQSVQGKWQCALRDNPVIASGTMAWTRVWRFSKLLLQTGC